MNNLKTAQVRQLKLEEIFGLKLNREETYHFFHFFFQSQEKYREKDKSDEL